MEKFAYKIQNILQEKLDLYRSLKMIFEKEQAVVAEMDIDALWKSIEEKKQIAGKIEKLKSALQLLMEDAPENIGGDRKSARISDLIRGLLIQKQDKAILTDLIVRINEQKEEIASLARENKKYLTDYLTIFDGIFSTVMDQKTDMKYSNAGSVLRNTDSNYLIRAEV